MFIAGVKGAAASSMQIKERTIENPITILSIEVSKTNNNHNYGLFICFSEFVNFLFNTTSTKNKKE
jgi:hypothetical protein